MLSKGGRKVSLLTDSVKIALGAELEHESAIRTIDKYSQKLSRLRKMRFSDFKSGNSLGGRPIKVAELNERQATP